jgi:hypothetical protein
MWNHPIFTFAGLREFWTNLATSYFRGELIWHNKLLASTGWDLFYAWSPLVFGLAGAAALLARRKALPDRQRAVNWVSVLAPVVSVVMLIGMSTRYDFGTWKAPSQEHPYFAAGRLIYGTMVPFLVVYLTGFDAILSALRIRASRLVLLAIILALMTVCEIWMSLGVFASQFNFYHMF